MHVNKAKLDELIDLTGKLVIAYANQEPPAKRFDDKDLAESVTNLSHLVKAIRNSAVEMRNLNIGDTFIEGFLVQAGTDRFIIPLEMVDECLSYYEVRHENDQCQPSITLRNQVLPVVRLKQLFDCNSTNLDTGDGGETKRENIVITHSGESRVGIIVDQLLGEQQTVIKPLGKMFQNPKGISGAAILGSGDLARIIDVPALVSDTGTQPASTTHTLTNRHTEPEQQAIVNS